MAKKLHQSAGALELVGATVDYPGRIQDLATRLGLSHVQLCHIRKGRNMPSIKQAAAIEDVLGIEIRSWLR